MDMYKHSGEAYAEAQIINRLEKFLSKKRETKLAGCIERNIANIVIRPADIVFKDIQDSCDIAELRQFGTLDVIDDRVIITVKRPDDAWPLWVKSLLLLGGALFDITCYIYFDSIVMFFIDLKLRFT